MDAPEYAPISENTNAQVVVSLRPQEADKVSTYYIRMDVIFPCCFGRVSSLVTVVSSANYAGNIDLHRKSDNDAMTSCLQNKLKERFARRILAFAN